MILCTLRNSSLHVRRHLTSADRAFLCSFGVFLFLWHASRIEADQPTPTPSPSPIVFSSQTLAELKSLQQAALNSDYAYRQVAHLANNIGPRLSGSAQAQKAVEYVARGIEGARSVKCELEKVMVPHWVRGEETAALVQFPGQAENTTQKIVLTALGGSVATTAEGLTAEVIVVRDFDELKIVRPREESRAKLCSFNYPSTSRWPRKVAAAMPTAKRSFIGATPERGRAAWSAWRL